MELVLAPGRYCREENALAKAGAIAVSYGQAAVIIGGHRALAVAGDALQAALTGTGVKVTGLVHYGGECSLDNVDRLVKTEAVRQAAVLIGVGGGRALDTVKMAAYRLNRPLITVPTVAATCAAWTMVAVVNDNAGAFVEVSSEAALPAAVIADTGILAAAPLDFLVAGIGDTLAKYYEAEISVRCRSELLPNERFALQIAIKLAERLMDTVAVQAVAEAKRRQPSAAFDEVVDAIFMEAGIVSNCGGDAARAAFAHSVYSALTILPPVHNSRHGAVVAFGILCQLMLDKVPEPEIRRYVEFSRQAGLPVTLAEIGLAVVSEAELRKVAEVTLGIPELRNMPYKVTADMVFAAVQAADTAGRREDKQYD